MKLVIYYLNETKKEVEVDDLRDAHWIAHLEGDHVDYYEVFNSSGEIVFTNGY